ncbi:MAG: hypothetical protein RL264_675 [Bacteroidota bacterium]
MNSIYSMRNFLSLLFSFTILLSWSQSSINDPKSYYGIGESGGTSHSIYSALGRNTINYYDSTQLNYFNPASYSSLSSGNTILSFEIQNRVSQFQSGGVSEYASAFNLESLAIGFKMKKRMGMAFGLRPFSTRGYSFSEGINTGTDSLQYSYNGTGGIQNFFVGYSYKLIHTNKVKLSLGTNLSYLFGSVNNQRIGLLVQTNNYQGGISNRVTGMKSFHYEFGGTFGYSINKAHQISVSGVFEPKQQLNAFAQDELFSASNIYTYSTWDTITYALENGKISSTGSFKVGLNYTFKTKPITRNNHTVNPAVVLLAHYGKSAAYSHNFTIFDQWNLSQSSQMGIGIEFIPEVNLFDNLSTLKWYEKMHYRLGAYNYQLPYTVLSSSAKDQGLSFGLSFPLLAQYSLSSLNLSINLGKRDLNSSTALQQKYIGINFGLVLSPSAFERWFRKRKLD